MHTLITIGVSLDLQAQELAHRFAENFKQFSDVPKEIMQAGPVVKIVINQKSSNKAGT